MKQYITLHSIAATLVIAAYLMYAISYVAMMQCEICGDAYYLSFDDPMVSMVYARNMVAGKGLVWQEGEYVEGYSNFLYTMYMSFLHLLPLDPMLLLNITGAILLGVVIVLVYYLTLKLTKSSTAALSAMFITAFYFPLMKWSFIGTEVAPMALLLMLATHFIFRYGRASIPLYITLALITLLRIDGIFYAVGLMLITACVSPGDWKRHVKLSGIVFIPFILLTIWRMSYYGDVLPNTYYLKVLGVPFSWRIMRGVYFFWENVVMHLTLPVFMLPFILLFTRFNKVQWGILMSIICLGLAHSILVGGDTWEEWYMPNRFITPVLPIFFALLSAALHTMFTGVTQSKLLATLGIATATLVIWVSIMGGYHSLWPEFLGMDLGFYREFHCSKIKASLFLNAATYDNATIAVVPAGIPGYYLQRKMIDALGKTDTHIAALQPHSATWRDIIPGHNKYDWNYSLGKADVLVKEWGDVREWVNKSGEWGELENPWLSLFYNSDSPNLKDIFYAPSEELLCS